MSKYRLTLSASRLFRLGHSAFFLISLVAVWLPKQDVLHDQVLWQTVLCVLIFCLWYREIRRIQCDPRYGECTWLVDERGHFASLHPAVLQRQISRNSRVTPFLLWLELYDALSPSRRHWKWVFRDQLDEQGFRRLSRIIHKIQSERTR